MRRLALSAVLMSLVILPAAGGDAYAATCTFNKSSDLWQVAGNWDGCGGNVPTAADDVVIPAGMAPSVTQNEPAGSLTLSGGQIAFFGAPIITVSGALGITSGTLVGDGRVAVGAGGSFAKTGAGQLVLNEGAKLQLDAGWSLSAGTILVTGTGAIIGGTTGAISGGTLTLNGSLTGSLTLTGGVLAGTGQITGTVTNTAGTVRPGGSPQVGRLSVTGSYTQGVGAAIEIDEQGTVPGTGFDVLAVAGPATFDGTVRVFHAPGFTPLVTDQFRFLTTTSPSLTTFPTLVAPSPDYQLDYTPTGPRLLLHTPWPTAPITTPFISIPAALDLGVVITCDPGTWTNNPTLTYEWLRESVVITGASAATYALTLDDAVHFIYCRVTGQSTGDPFAYTTLPVQTPGVRPFNTAPPTTTRAAAIGDTVTCSPGTWAGVPAPSFTYSWLRDGYLIAGGDGPVYTLIPADLGTDISCLVNANNAAGFRAVASASFTVAAVIPSIATAPKLTGTSKLGTTLACDGGQWDGVPAPTLTYEWLRSGEPIDGETQPSYRLASADGNRPVTCRVTATNRAGSTQAVSAAVKAAKNAEQLLAARSADKIATAVGVPSAKACVRANTLKITVRSISGVTFSSVSTKVAGRANRTTKSGTRFTTKINVLALKRRNLKRFVVAFTMKTATPRTIRTKRTFKIC